MNYESFLYANFVADENGNEQQQNEGKKNTEKAKHKYLHFIFVTYHDVFIFWG